MANRPDWLTATYVLGALLFAYYLVPLLTLIISGSASTIQHIDNPLVVTATLNSLLTATISTLLATTLGIPLAYWLARTNHRGKNIITAIAVLPLVLPPVVSGMLLLSVFGPNALGALTRPFGVSFTRSHFGVILAQTFVASPFVVITAKAAFESIDQTLEHASRSLGTSRWVTFKRITLPIARPGILAGITLAFARSMGEFGATLMLAYYPRTMPVQIWVSFVSQGLDTAYPIALILLTVAIAAITLITILGTTPWVTRARH